MSRSGLDENQLEQVYDNQDLDGRGSIVHALGELGLSADPELVELDMLDAGYERCPGCGWMCEEKRLCTDPEVPDYPLGCEWCVEEVYGDEVENAGN